MSNYTTELRYLIDTNFDLGLKEYPIFDESYRNVLNNKILQHFRFREIGFETAELFKYYLNVKMNEIMPYYNQLYKSELIEFNPLYNTELEETYKNKNETINNGTNKEQINNTETITKSKDFKEDKNETNKNKTTENKDNKNVFSDTPAGMLSYNDIQSNKYASNATYDEENNTYNNDGTITNKNTIIETNNDSVVNDGTRNNTTTNNINTMSEYTKKVSGYKGDKTYSELLINFRNTFLNIDMMVINELNNLFMLLW